MRALVWVLGLLLPVLSFAAGQAPGMGSAPRGPRAEGALDEGEPRVEVELVSDALQVAAGKPFRLGVRVRLDPGWHVYWRNPGDSGLASEVRFRAEGTQFSPLRFPFPQTLRTQDGFLTTYGYGDEVLLFAEARPPPTLKGPLQVEADVDLLACEVNCIPAKLKLGRSFQVGAASVPDAALTPLFDAASRKIPEPWSGPSPLLAAKAQATALGPGASFEARLELLEPGWGPGSDDFFVPDASDSFTALKLRPPSPGTARLEGELATSLTGAPLLRGVAHLRTAGGEERFVEVEFPLELDPAFVSPVSSGPATHGAAGAAGTPPVGLGWVLLLAFAGGALLNLMPCVFPVLALKTYGFARLAQEDRRTVASHALAYSVGVVGSLLLLAGAVSLAKLGGASVGWGFQFQEPLYVALVSAVVVAFALNLFGVFHLGVSATGITARVDASHGLLRSVGEGVLAVLLATPCSAPFLGTAVGFAFAAGTGVTFAVFALLGLGLAAPFCVLVLVPALARRLPRPGAWMERLKQLLGLTLLGTAAWLLWVMGGLAGVDGMGRLAGFLVTVAFAAWLFGVAQGTSPTPRRAGMVLALGVLIGMGVALLDFRTARAGASANTGVTSGAHAAQPWTEEAVRLALAQGRPVFVDFTADWCLTCKFNERTVLASDEVQDAFRRHNVALFVADWTRRDERIREALARHGRAGVPMYLVVRPEHPQTPTVLPELLTPKLVVDALTGETQ